MFTKKTPLLLFRSFNILIVLALLGASFLATPALAAGDGPVVSIERLHGLGVGVTIVFPDDVSEDMKIFVDGKMMDCELVALNMLYCVGNLRPNQAVTLTAYASTGMTLTFTATVSAPDLKDKPEPPPAPVFDPCKPKISELGGFKLASPALQFLDYIQEINNCDR